MTLRRIFVLLAAVALTALTAGVTGIGPASAVPAPRDDSFGGPTEIGGPGAANTWLFAEGTTRPDFDEFLLVLNSGLAPVNFKVTYLIEGAAPQVRNYTAPAQARLDIKVWAEIGRGLDHGTRVDAEGPIVVERAIYFNHGFDNVPDIANGATDVFGVTDAQSEYNFAEGTTLAGFQTFYLLANPSATPVTVNYTLTPQGGSGMPKTILLPANSRSTLVGTTEVGVGQTGIFGRFTSTSPFLAERAVYFSTPIAGSAIPVNGGTAAVGVLPANEWNLAEGTVLADWYEFLTIGNPGTLPVTINLAYAFEGTPGTARSVTVPAGSRATVQVFNATDPGGVGRDVSNVVSRGVSVRASASSPFVIERPLYVAGRDVAGLPNVNDGTVSTGIPGRPTFAYVFAEGTTLNGFRTFFTFQNPTSADAAIKVRYNTFGGGGAVVKDVVVPANARVTTNVGETQPGSLAQTNTSFGAVVESTNGVPFVVERPLYTNRAFEDIGDVIGATVVTGRPGGPLLSIAKTAPASAADGGVAAVAIALNVFEASAHGVTVVEALTVTDGIVSAVYNPASSSVPPGFSCVPIVAEVVCTGVGDTAPGSYPFTLTFNLINNTTSAQAIVDTAVVAALNADTAVVEASTTVQP